ncbi:nicotinic acid mononucleotide adenyltransferase [Flavobacteriaceae bacterium]|nr:nicotinic acid mononucleotide adenyltransferase [Flavobacteriaceae bacterium]
MKFPFILSILLFGFSSYAQETNELKTEKLFVKEGNVVKVTEYHDNGKIAQEGYLKNNKLHGKWVSYSSEGEKISIANYNKGKRDGTWLFWDQTGGLTQVDFKSNKFLKKVTWQEQTKVVKQR